MGKAGKGKTGVSFRRKARGAFDVAVGAPADPEGFLPREAVILRSSVIVSFILRAFPLPRHRRPSRHA